jgi:tRNA A37 methylthiotransferase MiaB
MHQQISKELKTERGAELARLDNQLRQEYFSQLVNAELQLLVEKVEDGIATGTSCRYAQVRCPAQSARENELIRVRVEQVHADHVSGRC